MIVLMEDGNMNMIQVFHLDQRGQSGFDKGPIGKHQQDVYQIPFEGSRPQLINPRTMKVNRYAIRDSVDIAIKEALRRT